MNYNTSINTGGVGGGFGSAIDKLRAPHTPSLAGSLFNLSPYQRGRMNPQASQEMQSQLTDTNRAGRWDAANNLQRAFEPADQQMKMAQLGAASDAAMNFFGNAGSLQNQQRGQGLDNMMFANSLMANLFGGGFGGMF